MRVMTEAKEQKIPQEETEGVEWQPRKLMAFADRIIESGMSDELKEELDPTEAFSGPILDLNNDLTPEEIAFATNWIEGKLGSKLEEAPIKARWRSPDGVTEAVIYDVKLGDNWWLSRWQNEGEEPSFVFWPQEVYDWQIEEAGFEEIKEETPQ